MEIEKKYGKQWFNNKLDEMLPKIDLASEPQELREDIDVDL